MQWGCEDGSSGICLRPLSWARPDLMGCSLRFLLQMLRPWWTCRLPTCPTSRSANCLGLMRWQVGSTLCSRHARRQRCALPGPTELTMCGGWTGTSLAAPPVTQACRPPSAAGLRLTQLHLSGIDADVLPPPGGYLESLQSLNLECCAATKASSACLPWHALLGGDIGVHASS